ncbi:Pyridoxal 5'-phosphate synthase subunit PdxT [bacterium HR23]|nr:Pyridoxal 5'-phosphate synthase subunit PdxT [bacterium HR23]
MLPKVPTPIPWQLALRTQGKAKLSPRVRVGVLALQGDFLEHRQALEALGVPVVEVRLPSDLEGIDALILPGGESTTMARLLDATGMRVPLVRRIQEGMPTWGTCAGMILLAKRLREDRPTPLGVMDIEVARNAFGRQVDSFEADLDIEGLSGGPFHAVFIRAPVLLSAGPGVHILARLPDGTPVAARQGAILATAFHPELTDDLRLHQWFLDMASTHRKE